jgi:hypothetical protein
MYLILRKLRRDRSGNVTTRHESALWSCHAAISPWIAERTVLNDEAIGRAEAIALMDEVFEHVFPGLHAS